MPTRVRSISGWILAAAWCHKIRSGKPASLRFFQQTSWNALERFAVPIPSMCTTMKPRSVRFENRRAGLKLLGTNDP